MAENVTLARPYAEAAFAIARESGRLEAWQDFLARLVLVVADEQVSACIADPRFEPERLQRLLLDSTGVAASAEQSNFVRLLLDNERAMTLAEISHIFSNLLDAHQGTSDAVVTSAFPLDEASRLRLQADLEAHFGAKLRMQVKLDPALIGGVRITVGDEVIDASVRGKLAAMAAALQN